MAFEIDDRVTDELTRPVKGDVASALHFEKIDPAGLEIPWRRDEVFVFCRAPEGDDGIMLEEKENILADFARNAGGGETTLQIERLGVPRDALSHDPELAIRQRSSRSSVNHPTHRI